MRNKMAMLALIPLLLLLTGCIKFDMALEVNKDSTVSGTVIFAMSDALAGLASASESDSKDLTDSLIDSQAKGVTTSKYKEGGFTGEKITLNRVAFREFTKGGGKEGDLEITKVGNLITLKGFLDLSSSDASTQDESDQFSKDIAAGMMSSADLKVSIKFPAKVIKSTGTISADGKSVSWTPEFGKKLDLATTVRLPSANGIILITVGGATTLLLGGFAYLLARKRKRSRLNTSSLTVVDDPVI